MHPSKQKSSLPPCDIAKEVLSNGLTLIEISCPHQNSVTISVYVKTGSRFEPVEQNGISHFLEHMVFRGTQQYPTAFDLNLAFERLGASVNGCTTPDSTEYTVSLPFQSAAKGAELLSQMVTQPRFNEIDTERKIIAEEILEDFDEHGNCIDIDSLSRERIWSNAPLSHPITGKIKNVLRFTYGDIEEWFRQHYVASNMVVCISGKVDAPKLRDVIRNQFGKVNTGQRTPPSQQNFVPNGAQYLHIHKPGSQTQLRLAFQTPGLLDPNYPAVEMLLRLIDDGMSTPLHRHIFENQALAYNVGAELEAYEDTGVFNIDAQASHENIHKILQEAVLILDNIKRGNFPKIDFQKAQNRTIWDLESLQDFPGALNAWYGEQETYRSAIHPFEAATRAKKLNAEQIVKMARMIFQKKNFFVTTVGIQSKQQQFHMETAVQSSVL